MFYNGSCAYRFGAGNNPIQPRNPRPFTQQTYGLPPVRNPQALKPSTPSTRRTPHDKNKRCCCRTADSLHDPLVADFQAPKLGIHRGLGGSTSCLRIWASNVTEKASGEEAAQKSNRLKVTMGYWVMYILQHLASHMSHGVHCWQRP